MCGSVCETGGWLGWLVFLCMLAGILAWLQYCQFRNRRQQQHLQRQRREQVLRFEQQNRLRERRPRCVQIGSLRETVEILDEPAIKHDGAIVRIKHRNGENVDIDYATLRRLMRSASRAGDTASLIA